MGMLDFDPRARDDASTGRTRPVRPLLQSNLTDTLVAPSSTRDQPQSASAAPHQSRGGRLGRLAYKKDDSIAFIAQSRNVSLQSAVEARNASLDVERSHPWSHSSASGAPRGLGIDGANSPPGFSTAPTDAYDRTDAPDAMLNRHAVGMATNSSQSNSLPSSSAGSSRAPSVAGMLGSGYHNRFSRQGIPPPLAQESLADTDNRPARSSSEAQAARATGSTEHRSSSPRGTLSDADIAALGAMPGASAGSLLNANGAPLSSKNILTIALQKAQNAVQLDSANNVPEAISAYKQAVRLLEEVMERIAPRNGKRSRPSREEERRRLRVIHDTYADRIRLLSMIYSPDDSDAHEDTTDTSFSGAEQPSASKPDWLDRMRHDTKDDPAAVTPTMNGQALEHELHYSPRDNSRSFLSITPVQSAFPPASQASSSPQIDQQPAQAKLPWPKSPPMQNAPLSPSLDSSPRRRRRDHARPGSRGSRGSRASISLSIADEQEVQDLRLPPVAIAEEMPSIAIEATTPEIDREAGSPVKDAGAGVHKRGVSPSDLAARQMQHGRSDSDSSYQSTTAAARLKPSALAYRSYGLDDEVRTPVTPYFDASGDVGLGADERASAVVSPAEAPARQHKLSLTSPASKPRVEAPEKPVERPAKMGLAQRARALSFKGPLLKKASMPSLSDRKKEEAAAVNSATLAKSQVRRPGTAESRPDEPNPALPTESAYDHPTPWDEEAGSNITVRAPNRPRATTASALVSSSVLAGTISQRRKIATATNGADSQAAGEADGQAGRATPGMDETDAREEHGPQSVPMSSRQRSTSQPGSRRPSIPAVFLAANSAASGGVPSALVGGATPASEDSLPPVPNLARTLSALELARAVDAKQLAKGAVAARGSGDVATSLAMPLPRAWAGDAETSMPTDSPSGAGQDAGEGPLLIADLFPAGLPSLAAGAPSYASGGLPAARRASLPQPPHAMLKPFFVMAQLSKSMATGAQITERLYVPASLWRQGGVKLLAVETKVRAIEALISALETVERGGEALLLPLGSGAGLETSNASRFVKHLEEFEGTMVEVQSTLSKKLAFIEAAGGGAGMGGGKKGFAGGFGRFTRGLDRMTGSGQSKVDAGSLGVYMDLLGRLLTRTRVLSSHLTWILIADESIPPPAARVVSPTGAMPSPTGIGIAQHNRTAYSVLPQGIRQTIQGKLTRTSEFFARVVVAWILQDLGSLLERTTKRGSNMLE